MQTKKFQRTIEDFICKHCLLHIKGTGYTNHCPRCLYSQHVDINPGDRLSPCKGMMKPISVELKNGQWIITHKCEKCGATKKNKTAPEDSIDTLSALSSRIA